MASLITLIRKHGLKLDNVAGAFRDLTMGPLLDSRLELAILHHDTPKVNCQNVFLDFSSEWDQIDPRRAFEDAVLPFPAMWFEWMDNDQVRIGVLARRQTLTGEDVQRVLAEGIVASENTDPFWRSEVKPLYFLLLEIFREANGRCIGPIGTTNILLDELGQPCAAGMSHGLMRETDFRADELQWQIYHIALVALESIVRMNTEGTMVKPPWKEHRLPGKVRQIVPACVWHTIHIGPAENIERAPESSVALEAQGRREHWVRAHRKDYRKGVGLFGRIKKLIWVREHKSGDPKLGCVIPEFEIDSRKK